MKHLKMINHHEKHVSRSVVGRESIEPSAKMLTKLRESGNCKQTQYVAELVVSIFKELAGWRSDPFHQRRI